MKPHKLYREFVADLSKKSVTFGIWLRKLKLYKAYGETRRVSLTDASTLTPQQAEAMSAAQMNALSAGFWLTKVGLNVVGPCRVIEDTSRMIEEIINVAPQPQPYACRRGCHFCCYEAVDVSVVEAKALAQHVRELPAPERAAVTGKLERYAARKRHSSDDQMYEAHIPCPFLDVSSGYCTVYAIRPYMCRALTSYDVAPCKTGEHEYLVDHVRYFAYGGALQGAENFELPNEQAARATALDSAAENNLAIRVLAELETQ